MFDPGIIGWLLESPEPWTRYRTRVDLLAQGVDEPQVQADRAAMLAHAQVQELLSGASQWPGAPLKRHNDAGHPLYKISTLADLGLRQDDPGMAQVICAVMAHQAEQGPFQTLALIPAAFGGSNQADWSWMACDAPTLLYALLAFGLEGDPRVQHALAHLPDVVSENGWRCVVAPELGKFHGPGRRSDPCPIANVYALKALAQSAQGRESPAAQQGIEMLLGHWERQKQEKPYLFGIGSDFRKLKYPFVWYDLLHVVDVLAQYPSARGDPRFQQMVEAIKCQAGPDGRYTATSMYLSWKGWSFADKKQPSPWLTFLVLRAIKTAQA